MGGWAEVGVCVCEREIYILFFCEMIASSALRLQVFL